MIKNGVVFLISLLSLLPAFAEKSENVLITRTYRVRIQAGGVSCHNGVPPNGHNYPVPTRLTFDLVHYDLWLSNIWTNIDHYEAAVEYRPCSEFPKILRPAPEQDLIGTVTQRVSESYMLNGFKACMRVTREEAEMSVDGLKFNGVSEFTVGPVDDNLCKN